MKIIKIKPKVKKKKNRKSLFFRIVFETRRALIEFEIKPSLWKQILNYFG
jgi:hypothetical protein